MYHKDIARLEWEIIDDNHREMRAEGYMRNYKLHVNEERTKFTVEICMKDWKKVGTNHVFYTHTEVMDFVNEDNVYWVNKNA